VARRTIGDRPAPSLAKEDQQAVEPSGPAKGHGGEWQTELALPTFLRSTKSIGPTSVACLLLLSAGDGTAFPRRRRRLAGCSTKEQLVLEAAAAASIVRLIGTKPIGGRIARLVWLVLARRGQEKKEERSGRLGAPGASFSRAVVATGIWARLWAQGMHGISFSVFRNSVKMWVIFSVFHFTEK